MDARQEKGRQLSNDKRIKRVEGALWFVPSQSQNAGGYLVNVLAATCHETRRVRCKHMIAVEIVQTVEVQPDGSATVTESIKVTRKSQRGQGENEGSHRHGEHRGGHGLRADLGT